MFDNGYRKDIFICKIVSLNVFSGAEGNGEDDYKMTVRSKMIGGRLSNASDADVNILGGVHGREVIKIPCHIDPPVCENKYVVIELPLDDELVNNYMSF